MSNPVQGVLAVAGAVIGSAWGPAGAAYGFSIGLQIGTLVSPTQLPPVFGPRLEDFNTTTSQVGGPVFITYGTITVPGTVIWLGAVREETTSEEVGGKGGPEQTVTTYSYFQSIALGLCEGPIGGVLRIWENGELVYDIREQQEDETSEAYIGRVQAAAEYATGFVLYLGTADQEPNTEMEATFGEGNVPAFRDLAYIIYIDRPLQDDQARRHPNFRFEVYHEGTGSRRVLDPIHLAADANGSQDSEIAVLWSDDKYLVWDGTGADDWLRAYSILSPENTEYAQKAFTDYTTGVWGFVPTIYGMVGGADGYFYVWGPYHFADELDYLHKLDPETLEIIDSNFTLSEYYWTANTVLSMNVTRGSRTECVLVNADALFDTSIAVVNATRDGMPQIFSANPSALTDAIVAIGGSDEGTSYAYILCWETAVSGTSSPAELYRLTCTIPPDNPITGPDLMTVGLEQIMTIAPSDINVGSPSMTRWGAVVASMFVDQSDDCVVFGFSAHGPGASDPAFERFVKVDPATATIVWVSEEIPAGFGADAFSECDATSVPSKGIIHLKGPATGNTVSIDMSTGEFGEQIDWTPYSAALNSSPGFNGQRVFNNSLGAIIARTTDGWFVLLDGTGPTDCVTLAEIVTDVCDRVGLTSSDIDVSDLDICIHGYALTRNMPAREAIEPLRPIGPFDAVESGLQIKFPTRGKGHVAILDSEDLGAHEFGSAVPPAVTTKKTQDVELPRVVRMKYIGQDRDYEPAEQVSPVRLETDAVNDVNIEIPVAFINDQQAARTVEMIWADAWASRWRHSVAVDQSYSRLEPADAILIPVDGDLQRVRIVAIDESIPNIRKLDCLRDDDGSFEPVAIATSPLIEVTTLSLLSDTELLLLDLPPLRDEDDDAGIYAVGYPETQGTGWRGAVIFRSSDNGQTFSNVASVTRIGTVGTLVEALPSGITETWDEANEIVVDMLSGSLESREDDASLFNGANGAAIGSDGRWEIVQFHYAEQISPGRFRLSKLLRGRRGTEHHVGSSVVGDSFVLLSNGAPVRVPLQTSDISLERTYRAVSIGKAFSSGTDQAFTGEGVALEPFSPVQIEGTRDGSGNLTITWVRRGRLGQELPGDADIPLSEETESYEVDIIEAGSPDAVARTITATSQTCTYTAAQQITDSGAVRASVTVRVYQLSAIVGRGTPGVATI